MSSLEAVSKLYNKQLRSQIMDLEQSLKINKKLMHDVLLSTNMDETLKEIINKLEAEVGRLNETVNNIHKEKLQLYETTKKCK